MFDKAPVNRLNGYSWGHNNVDENDLESGGVRRMIADVTELAELQGRLAVNDVKCLVESAIRPLIMGIVAVVIVLATLPVLLFAAANALVDQLDWSPALAQAAVGGVGILIAGILIAIAVKKLNRCGSPLRRSLDELEKNLGILREILVGRDAVQAHLAHMERRDREN